MWAVAAAVLAAAGGAQAAERRTLIVAGGEVTGYNYPAAGAVCRVVNKERPQGLSCAVMPTAGSAANLAALKAGDADLAVVQARAAQLAAGGEEGFKDLGAMPEMRALMSLHGEAAAVLVRPDAGIGSVAEIKGKRVNLGRPGSFQRAMAEVVIEVAGLSQGDLSPLVELDYAEQGHELCMGNIDAAVFTGVHPIPEVASAMEECGAVLVPLKSKPLDTHLKRQPWLSRMAIKPGTYDGQKEEIATIGVRALLVATTRMTAEEAHDVAKAVWANFTAFTRLHPALRSLQKAEAAHEGIPLPMHDGAARFYAETAAR
jgi:TRAP transporter TAXI family solute receptor